MEALGNLFASAVAIFKTPMTVFGFTFSWWDVFIWSIVAGLLIWFIGRVFSD